MLDTTDTGIALFRDLKHRDLHPDAQIARRIREDFSLYHVSDERDAFRVRVLNNPLKPETYSDHIYPYGTSIATIMLANGMHIDSPAIIYVNGEQIVVRDRESFFPNRNASVTIRIVWGGEGSAIQMGFTLLGAAVGSLVGQPMLGAMVGSMVGGVVSGLVVGGPKQPKMSALPNVYTISGSTNLLAPYSMIPLPEGKRKATMLWYGAPYNETGRHEQFIRLLATVGYGPCDMNQYKIKGTDITSYDNVLMDIRNGYPDDAPLVLYTGIPSQTNLSVTLLDTTGNNTSGTGWSQATTVPNVSEIAVDFAAPNGISTTNDVGNTRWAMVTIRVRYALVGTDHTADANWNELAPVKMLGYTQRQLLATKRWSVTPGQYDVECEVSAVKFQRNGSAAVGNIFEGSITWIALRSFIAGNAVNIPGQTQVAIRIKGTAQLNGDINDLTCVAQRVTRLWDATGGSGSTGSWENKAGSWFYDYEKVGNGAAYYDLDTANPQVAGGKDLRIHLATNGDGAYVACKAIPVRWPSPKHGQVVAYPGDFFDVTIWYRSSAALTGGIYARMLFSDTTDVLQQDFPITLAIPSSGGGAPPWNVLNNQSTPDAAWHSVTVTGIGIPNHGVIAANRNIHTPNHARFARLEIGATNPTGGAIDVYFDSIVSAHKDGDAGTKFTSNWIPNGSFDYPGQGNSNPASAYRDLFQGDRSVGFTVPDSRMNLREIQTFSEYCRINDFNYDGRLDEEGTAIMDAANRILEAGRGSRRDNDGMYGVVIDQGGKTPVGMVTDRTMIKGSYSWEAPFIDKPHGYRVRFADALNDYTTLEVLAFDKGYSSGGPVAQSNEVLFTGDGATASFANATGFGIRCWPIGTSTIIGYVAIGTSLSISTITSASTTATLTTSGAHGLSTGQFVTIKGTAQYNGVYQITVTGTTTFTFAIPAAKPAAGAVGNVCRSYQFTDNGAGVISGTHVTSGTVNYNTGAWMLVLDTAPTNGYDSVVNYTGFSGTTTAIRVEDYDLSESKVSPVDAWRFGMFKLTNDRLHGVLHKWEAFREHIMYQRGDVVYLQHFATNMALGSSRIKINGVTSNGSGDATSIAIDDKWLLSSTSTQVVRIRRSDNTFILANIQTPADDTLTGTITFQTPISHTGPQPEDGDVVSFGDPPQVLILGIDPGDNHNSRKFTAVAYDPAVYTAEQAAYPYATTINQVVLFPKPTLKQVSTDDGVQSATPEGTRMPQIVLDLDNTTALHSSMFKSDPLLRVQYRGSNTDFPSGGTDRGAYDPTATYNIDDVITYYDGTTWESLIGSNTGQDPVVNEDTKWTNITASDQPYDEVLVPMMPQIVLHKYIEAKRYYDLRVRYESSTGGQFGPWLEINRVQVVHQVTLPGPLQSATATYTGTLGKIKLAWVMPKTGPPPSRVNRNIKWIEVRLDNGSGVWANGTDGAGGGAGTFVYRGKATHFIVNDLVAASYTYLFKAIDTNDNYAADADMVTASITITAAQASLDSVPDGDFVKTTGRHGSAIVIQNGDFELSAVLPPPGWVASGGTNSYETSSPFDGNRSLKLTTTTLGGSAGLIHKIKWKAKPGEIFKLAGAIKNDGNGTTFALLQALDKNGAFISQIINLSTSSTSYQQQAGTGTAPANTKTVQLVLQVNANPSLNSVGTYDDLHAVRNASIDDEVWEDTTSGTYNRTKRTAIKGGIPRNKIQHLFPTSDTMLDPDGVRVAVTSLFTTGALSNYLQTGNGTLVYNGNLEGEFTIEFDGSFICFLPNASAGTTNNGYLFAASGSSGAAPITIYRITGGTPVAIATYGIVNAGTLTGPHQIWFRWHKANGKFEMRMDGGDIQITATDKIYTLNGPIGVATGTAGHSIYLSQCVLKGHSGIHKTNQDPNGKALIDANQTGHIGLYGAGSLQESFMRQAIMVFGKDTISKAFFSRDSISWFYAALPSTPSYVPGGGGDAIVWTGTTYIGLVQNHGTHHSKSMTSPDGLVWTVSSDIAADLSSVAWSPSLGLAVAVGLSGALYSSPDGLTWTLRTSGTGNSLNSVTWSADLGLFVAVGASGTIITSANGTSWTTRTGASSQNQNAVVWASDIGLFISVGARINIQTSPDGITWTLQTSGTVGSATYSGITWSGTLAVVVGTSGAISTSLDAVTWTGRSSGTANNLACVSWIGTRFAAGGDTGTLLYSLDGITWTANTGFNSGDSLVAIITGPAGMEPALSKFSHTVLSGDTNYTASSSSAIITASVITPPGGPSRVQCNWALTLGAATGAEDVVDVWVSDGTDTWAAGGAHISTTKGNKCASHGLSPNTYPPNTTVSLSLFVQCGHNFTAKVNPLNGGPVSHLDAHAVHAN